MTAAEIIADAESQVRITTGPTTAQILAWLSRIQRGYCRRFDFPELKLTAQTLSTTANQGYISLPSNFDRFLGRTVLYDPTAITGGYQGGTLLPILGVGSRELEEGIAVWQGMGAGTPQAVSLGGTTGAYKLYVYPLPSLGSVTIVYNYWKAPTNFATTADTLAIPALGDTFTMALCRQFCAYASDDRLAYFAAEERRAWNDVQRNYLVT